jgi:hypothetical protein
MELGRAINSGNLEEVRRLIREGADVNARFPHIPWERLDINDPNYLLYANLNNSEYPIFMVATLFSEENGPAILQALLEAGVDINVRNSSGQTPLHKATMNWQTVAVLLDAGADPNAKDIYDRTPLDGHLSRINLNSLALLLSAGADVVSSRDMRRLIADRIRAGRNDLLNEDQVRLLQFGNLKPAQFSAMVEDFVKRGVLDPIVAPRLRERHKTLYLANPGGMGRRHHILRAYGTRRNAEATESAAWTARYEARKATEAAARAAEAAGGAGAGAGATAPNTKSSGCKGSACVISGGRRRTTRRTRRTRLSRRH